MKQTKETIDKQTNCNTGTSAAAHSLMSVCQQQNIHRSAVVPHGVPQIPGPGLLSLDPKQDHQRPIPEPEGTRRRTKNVHTTERCLLPHEKHVRCHL
ncbi:hypothetical protein BaRGS_00023792 [Batillaria attramentaria]|uniref:Uncharacterized protein n=1 Tax=Batillaria attramentaria TaxID=370345 RepID=A0ABD0KCX0_9CAEN